MIKILQKIKKFIVGVIGCIFFAFAISVTVLLLNYNKYGLTQFGNTTLVMISDFITSETYKKGDLVLVKSGKLTDLELGEEIFVYRIMSNNKILVEVGKVGQIYPEEDNIAFENGDIFSKEFVIGKADKVYNKIGTYLSIIESKWGFLFIVLVPCLLIFIYEIYALIIEIKYGAYENE
jgi:hypothetical protein